MTQKAEEDPAIRTIQEQIKNMKTKMVEENERESKKKKNIKKWKFIIIKYNAEESGESVIASGPALSRERF